MKKITQPHFRWVIFFVKYKFQQGCLFDLVSEKSLYRNRLLSIKELCSFDLVSDKSRHCGQKITGLSVKA